MTIVLVGGLLIVSLYLGKRLSDVNSENTALRDQIASLKRQVKRRS
jgi:hypothetical protein